MCSAILHAGCTCPACMASIGARAISAQATMTTSSAAAMDFFIIPIQCGRSKMPTM
jgi:hypothetical protein